MQSEKDIKEHAENWFKDNRRINESSLSQIDDGWIQIETILKSMTETITTDSNKILKALESSRVVEISEDKKRIRRSSHVQEDEDC